MFVLSSRLTYNFLTVETELHGQGLGLVLKDCQTKYEISPNPVATVSCNVLVFDYKKASAAPPLPAPSQKSLGFKKLHAPRRTRPGMAARVARVASGSILPSTGPERRET
jgi:hypothetical protein